MLQNIACKISIRIFTRAEFCMRLISVQCHQWKSLFMWNILHETFNSCLLSFTLLYYIRAKTYASEIKRDRCNMFIFSYTWGWCNKNKQQRCVCSGHSQHSAKKHLSAIAYLLTLVKIKIIFLSLCDLVNRSWFFGMYVALF